MLTPQHVRAMQVEIRDRLVPDWTTADQAAADREGWNLIVTEHGPVVQRDDRRMVFSTDRLAVFHCVMMSDVSTMHARALAIHFHTLANRS